MPQVLELAKYCVGVLDKLRPAAALDVPAAALDALRYTLLEVYASLVEVHQQHSGLAEALETATKACQATTPGAGVYARRHLVALVSRLLTKTASLPKAKAIEAPRFDNPLLTALCTIHLAENASSRDIRQQMTTKAAATLVRMLQHCTTYSLIHYVLCILFNSRRARR